MYEHYVNRPPQILTEDVLFATQDVPYFVRYDAVDNDPTTDVISWEIRTDAHWLDVNNSNATLFGIPTNDDVGIYWVNVTVMDDRGGRNWSNFTLTVLNVNDPPTILTGIIPDAVQNIAYSFFLSGEDLDPTEDLLTWSMSTDASWIDLDPGTGKLFGTPGNDDVGVFYLNITLDDGNGGFDVLNTSITVHNVNDDPIISTIPREYVYQDEKYVQSFEFYDIDPTDDILSVYFETNASFLFYEASIYTVQGTPKNDDVGEYWINFTVKDDKGGIGILNYTLTVLNVNDPPVIMTRNVKVAAQDVEYRVRYEAYDPDGDDLLWSLDTDSTFLSMDPLTGILSGTPSNDDVGLWNVNVSVSDGVLSAYSDFVLEVLNV
ncbi:MAG: putative Ig domain-containing protein, partial [Candidatus Thermoplasmatota archaeon]|nr:putative Ig domain-containing protein [Candidatus Thermoplasmatota archaeon]